MNTHPGRNIDKWSNCNSWSSSSTLPFRKKEEKVTLSITQLCIQRIEILLFSKVLDWAVNKKQINISFYLSPLSLLFSFSLYLCLRIQQTAVFVAALRWNMEKALAATALRKFCRIHNIIMVNSDETFLQSKVNSTFNIPLNLINKSKNHNHSSDIPFLHSWLELFPDSWIQRHILRTLPCGRPGGQSQLFFLPGNNKDLSQDLLVFLKFHMKSYV